MMRVDLFLMNEKGYSTLCSVLQSQYGSLINRVISSKDKGVLNDFYDEIKLTCSNHNLSFLDRSEYTNDSSVNYKIAIGWRWMIEESDNLIVIHDSLLPKYRGFAPLVTALINGDTRIGISAIFADSDYDTGPIISQRSLTIAYPCTIQELITKVSKLYIEVVLHILSEISAKSKLDYQAQDESKVTYSIWRDDHDYLIDWYKSSKEIKRFIDALGYPYQGAKTYMEDTSLTITNCEVIDDVNFEIRQPGKVFKIENGNPVIICGSGLLKVLSLNNSSGEPISISKLRTRFRNDPFQ